MALVPDRIDLERAVELHAEPEVHLPQRGERPAGDASRRGLLRGLHARDHPPRQLARGGPGLERVPRDGVEHAPQSHHRIPLAEIRRLPPSDRYGGVFWSGILSRRRRPDDLPADGRDADGHQGADQVEEAVGGVNEGGDGEDGGLGHAAGGPGIEGRGDRSGVLDAAAEEPAFVAAVAESLSEDVGCQQDRQVLVGHDAVQGGSGDDGRCDQAGARAGEGRQEAGQVRDHAAGLHARAEAHRAEDQEHRVEHAQHAPRDQQAVHLGMSRFQGNRVVDAFDRAGEQHAGAGAGGDFRADAGDDVGLEDECSDGRDEHGDGEHLQRRHASGNEEEREDRDDEQPGRDVEFRRKDGGVKLGLDRAAAGVR